MSEIQKEMSIIDHLRELRTFLIHSIMGILVGAVVVGLNIKYIFDNIIFAPKDPNFITYKMMCKMSDALCIEKIPIQITNLQMTGQFSAHIWTSIVFGIIIAFPYIIYELWKFIRPALYENEKKMGLAFILVSSFLFMLGIMFGYFIIAPLSINFFGNYSITDQIVNQIKLASYLSMIRTTILANGIVFELPVIIYFLAKGGIVSSTFLKENRKYAIILVLVLAAFITPPDVISQIIVAIPLIILYEVSIYIARWIEKGRSDDLVVK